MPAAIQAIVSRIGRMLAVVWALCALCVVTGAVAADVPVAAQAQRRELLLYIGITMVKPMQEIARIMEEREKVRITLIQGSSDDLYLSLRSSRKGDLYLPGSASYRTRFAGEGLFRDDVLVGHNVAALVVAKRNPKRVGPSARELLRRDLSVVIANPEASSIGTETKRLLTAAGVFDQAFVRSVYLATDSRNLSQALRSGEADLILNWRSTAFFPENRDVMDVVDLDPELARPDPLYLIRMKFAAHPEIAQRIMEFAASAPGQAIFRKHGFPDGAMRREF